MYFCTRIRKTEHKFGRQCIVSMYATFGCAKEEIEAKSKKNERLREWERKSPLLYTYRWLGSSRSSHEFPLGRTARIEQGRNIAVGLVLKMEIIRLTATLSVSQREFEILLKLILLIRFVPLENGFSMARVSVCSRRPKFTLFLCVYPYYIYFSYFLWL